MEQNKWLISVALNRRHLTEGQKAVLANNYSTILSEKLSSDAGKKAINARWHPDKEYDEATVAFTYEDEVNRSRKLAAERLKVSERKVRSSEYSKVINPPWRRQSPPGTIENKNAPVRRLPTNLTKVTSYRRLSPTR